MEKKGKKERRENRDYRKQGKVKYHEGEAISGRERSMARSDVG